MKKLFFIISIFCVVKANAQNYFIDFAGTGASTSVGTVKVDNLTAGTSLTLNGTDILHLVGIITGVTTVENKQSIELKIYPNPMRYNAVFQFYPPVEGIAIIRVIDIAGKVVLQSQYSLENNLQEFRLSGLKSGFYIIFIKGSSYQTSGKLLCNGSPDEKLSIERISVNQKTAEKTKVKVSKGLLSAVDMNYTAGDRLKFTGTSGIYSTVFMDIPASDKTITFNFIQCTDGDNNNYPVVKIGNQVWMAENLKTTNYNDGVQIPLSVNSNEWYKLFTPRYCWYNNDEGNNKSIYGALYNWQTGNTGKLCPAGWHIPSDWEWRNLTGNFDVGNIAGEKLKETGNSHWLEPNTGATNETGFEALPGGFRSIDGTFHEVGNSGNFWCSNPYSGDAYYLYMTYNSQTVFINTINQQNGFSVRCISNPLPALPIVSTSEATSFTQISAMGGGNVKNDGGSAVTSRGLCWNTSPAPTTNNNKTSDGSGTGTFTSLIEGLTLNSTYYVRAFATNSLGTAYGNEISFTVSLFPVLTSTAVSAVTQNSASCGGNITNEGCAGVTARGVCWSTSVNPSLTDNYISDGTGSGLFTNVMSGLAPNTIYHVRAYASNSLGTSYGRELIFKTYTGQVTDIDGNVYNTVTIGTQVWMAENLRTTRYRNGELIGTQFTYDNIEINADIYGRLYTWYPVSDNRHICPEGWHSPIVNEWTTLTTYLTNNGYGYEGSGSDITKSMASTSGWISSSIEGTPGKDMAANNNSGFSAIPGGERYAGTFNYPGDYAEWWCSDEYSTNRNYSNYVKFNSNSKDLTKSFTSKDNGFSVRCLWPDLTIPTIITTTVTGIGLNSATSGGNITSDGGDLISGCGICWSTSHNPTTSGSHTSGSSGSGIFALNLTGLTDYTTYYVRAYAINSIGMAYGNEVEFTTNPCLLPTLSTTAITQIAPRSATGGGNILSNGGCSVLNSGVCWSILPNPTISDSHTTGTTGSGSFSGNLTGLSGGTSYYVRAYATNRSGTGYGNEISFATSPLTIITGSITSITQTGAKSGGNITNDGGSVITARGVCWSTFENPTIADNFTSDGTGDGTYISNLAGLTPNTAYHLRAFATNSYGTAYGAQVNFTTKYSGDNIVTDIEGNVYNIVTIGSQVWMAENLKTTKYNDGTSIPTFTDNWEQNTLGIAAYCDYHNTPAYSDIYGRLYNWRVVDPNNPHNICPTGWHAPSDAEWTILTTYLGGENVAGGKLKETGTTHWATPNEGATNETGFTALPGGNCRFSGDFMSMGSSAYWWSTTYVPSESALYRRIYNNAPVVERNSFVGQCAYSVRCLKDN